jgi:uncharacterized RDD family membrane protein YckC
MTILDQPLSAETPVAYASFGERFIARLIDGFILLIPSLFLPFVLPWLYFALQEGSDGGATIGKRAMGIRVLSTEGRSVGFGTATGRFLCHFINLFTLGIGYLLMLFNARSQGLHDIITSTIVVKSSSTSQASRPADHAKDHRSWSRIVSDQESHFAEIKPEGGRYRHRMAGNEHVRQFTLWQVADGLVDFSAEFGPEAANEMKQFAEFLLRSKFSS